MASIIGANGLFVNGEHKRAFDTYMELVEKGSNAIAASNVGYMYHRGIGVVRNYKKAMAYYEAAAELDGGVAFFNMALMYMRGQGVRVDVKHGIKLMQSSADHGCPDAALYLGLAYIMGYAYDPVEIECLSLIPFYRVIYRDPSAALLGGEGFDADIEDSRYEAIEADADEAIELYNTLSREHRDDPYAERQVATASFMVGKAYVEGLGDRYDPRLGYRRIYNTAIMSHCAEAAQYLITNSESAVAYGIDPARIEKLELLASRNYFRSTMGSLGTPRSHRVPLLLPEDGE